MIVVKKNWLTSVGGRTVQHSAPTYTAVQSYPMILFYFIAYSNTANYILVILDYILAFRVTTPDAVLIQFNLLLMSKIARKM
jgi:hypothetical protein